MLLVPPVAITDTVLTASSVAEIEAVYNAGTAYADGAQVRPTASGADSHRLFESQVGSNTGNNPLTDDGTHWLEIGVTNRYRAFDGSPQSQTTSPDIISWTLDIAGRVDTVSIQNLAAASFTVTGADDVDGVVYSHSEDLVSDEGIDDWYKYFTEELIRRTDITLVDLPATYSDLQWDISLTAIGETVAVGLIVLGQSLDLGGTRWGGTVSVRDFSTKEFNDFGDAIIVERAYAKRGQFDAVMLGSSGERAAQILARYRATPVLLVGDADHPSTSIYGFISDWTLEKVTPGLDVLSLEFEGLT